MAPELARDAAPTTSEPTMTDGVSPDAAARVAVPADDRGPTHDRSKESAKLNQLRAGVLGANDGIVSIAGMVVGVAAATPQLAPLIVAGAAALAGGALSMAMGEYVSVSTQRDTERATLERARKNLREHPERELAALVEALEQTGIPNDLAQQAAERMTEHDALDAHTRVRFGLEEEAFASPMGAAAASFVAFILGGILPLLAVLLVPVPWKIPATFAAVIIALGLTGAISAKLGQAKAGRATLRTIAGGSAAMLVTYGLGALLGVGLA